MRKENSDFKTVYLSEAGSQLENRDYFGYIELDYFACWVMASSIDEYEMKISAEIVVKNILDSFLLKPGMSRRHISAYIREANELLQRESKVSRLKASVMIVVSDYMSFRWGSAGNVHLKVIAGNHFCVESEDQSYYQQKINDGTFPKDRSKGFTERNNLTQYLGTIDTFKPFISSRQELKELDTMILTTVGLWEHVTDIELLDATEGTKEPQEVIDNVEDLLLSKQMTELHNYTIATIFINKLYFKEKKIWPIVKRVLLIAIPILLIIGLFIFFHIRSEQKQMELLKQTKSHELLGNQYVEDGNYKRALEEYNIALKIAKDIKKYNTKSLDLKQRTSQLLVDGDASLDKDDLTDAKKYYVKARDLIVDHDKTLADFDLGAVSKRLAYINSKIYISDLTKLGDTQLEAEQYDAAKKSYQKAKATAVSINDQQALKDLDVKLNTATSQQNAAQTNIDKAAADKAAAEADQVAKSDPDKAAANYEAVAKKYDDAGLPDKAAQMRAKAAESQTEAQENDDAQQVEVALGMEKKGDSALANKDYTVATANYQAAQSIYQTANQMTSVLKVQQKIDAANDLKKAEEEAQVQKKAEEAEKQKAAIEKAAKEAAEKEVTEKAAKEKAEKTTTEEKK
ncbi:hypothetical protein HCB21_12680 [Listeria booriae]|uniref:hypothetical protein n=1 Tax=Listeria booriae TaxID=1552123 RepID=UPI0016278F1F|nr:hypothetical protein [Listeria booriae]MBC2160638.1 hypothetical protein [Listeria booriae]